MVTNGEHIEVSLNAFRDLVGQFALRDRARFFPPVFHGDLETHQWVYRWRTTINSHLTELSVGWVPGELVSGRTNFSRAFSIRTRSIDVPIADTRQGP